MVPPVATVAANPLMQICVKVYTTTCKTVVSVFITINALTGLDITRPCRLVSGETLKASVFPRRSEALLYSYSILEENKHRSNATCANNYNACPKRVLQLSFFAKSLVLALLKDGQRRFVVRRRKPKFYRQRLRKEHGLRDSLTCEAIRRVLFEPNGLRLCLKCSKLGRVPN